MSSANIIRITLKNIDSKIDDLFKMQRSGNYVFRGISNEDQLLPSLYRYYDKNQIKKTGMNLLAYEKWLLEEYGKYSSQYIANVFTPLDWVASAQHFGLPTRLIDWSFDPFCALYFCLFGEITDNNQEYRILAANIQSHIYCNDVPIFERGYDNPEDTNNKFIGSYTNFVNALVGVSSEFNKPYGYNTRKSRFTNMIYKANKKERDEGKHSLFFCSIYDSNPRIIAQSGLFQIPRKSEDEDIKKLTIDGCEKIFIIDKDARKEILKILKQLNITTPRLFPDLQNICEYIKKEKPKYDVYE